MSRSKRWNIEGMPQLVRLEGHNGTTVFRKARDYEYFIDLMAECAIDYNCDVRTFFTRKQAKVF